MGAIRDYVGFHFMVLVFRVRDFFEPPARVLENVGIRGGSTVLDYACGTGCFTFAAAERVGPAGAVIAADVNPVAVRRVRRIAEKRNIENVEAIETDCPTGRDDASVDVVLLYDAFHMFPDPHAVLAELHRVLKPTGILSFSDHHLGHEDILESFSVSGLFRLLRRSGGLYTFAKVSATDTQARPALEESGP